MYNSTDIANTEILIFNALNGTCAYAISQILLKKMQF